MCRQSHRGCHRHQGLGEHGRHQLRLELKAGCSGGASLSRQLLPGLCSGRLSCREQANPSRAIMGASPSRWPCPAKARETSWLQERVFSSDMVGVRAAASELPASGVSYTSGSTHPACPNVPVGRCPQLSHQLHGAGRLMPLTSDKRPTWLCPLGQFPKPSRSTVPPEGQGMPMVPFPQLVPASHWLPPMVQSLATSDQK